MTDLILIYRKLYRVTVYVGYVNAKLNRKKYITINYPNFITVTCKVYLR